MKRVLSVLLLSILGVLANAQTMKSIVFHDQKIRDILLALGTLNNVSVVPDETVTGKVSYVFSNMNFLQAFHLFLETFHLHDTEKNGVYLVSKVSITPRGNHRFNLSADDVPLQSILRLVSAQEQKTILWDNLPNDPVTMHIQNATVADVLSIAVAKYPGYRVEDHKVYYFLRNASISGASNWVSSNALSKLGNLYNLNITEGRFKNLVLQLFHLAQKPFLLLLDRDVNIENVYLKNLTFNEALRVFLLQAGGDFKLEHGTYVIFPVQQNQLMKKFLTNIVIPFKYISSAEFLKLLPPELSSSDVFRLDDRGNRIVLSGSLGQIKPIMDFIHLIDKPSKGNQLVRVDLKYVKTDEVIPLMPPSLANFNPQPLPGKTALLVSIPQEKEKDLFNFISLVDRPVHDTPIHLRYMQADDLLAKLPPSVTKDNIIKTSDPSMVFFQGSDSLLHQFRIDLAQIDTPRPLLRYEIMVLQYDLSKELQFNKNFGPSSSNNDHQFIGNLANVLNFNFDVVGNFGSGFALNLNASLADNDAKVVADTTLNGLSGEKISFQNTQSTYYVANEINTTGSATVTGNVNQLSSGLILGLEGWISADNMVTLKVDATLSKQDATSSSTSTLPPNTQEKKLSTEVRMPSGKPLVIGGLMEDDKTTVVTKVPLLGDIPFLGWLFQNRDNRVQHTEFSIYIVPILDRPEETNLSNDERLMVLYKKFYGSLHGSSAGL